MNQKLLLSSILVMAGFLLAPIAPVNAWGGIVNIDPELPGLSYSVQYPDYYYDVTNGRHHVAFDLSITEGGHEVWYATSTTGQDWTYLKVSPNSSVLSPWVQLAVTTNETVAVVFGSGVTEKSNVTLAWKGPSDPNFSLIQLDKSLAGYSTQVDVATSGNEIFTVFQHEGAIRAASTTTNYVPFNISEGTDDFRPRVAADSLGNFHIGWMARSMPSDVYYTKYYANGTLTPPEMISRNMESSATMAIAVDHSNNLHIVYLWRNTDLVHATLEDAGWVFENVTTSMGMSGGNMYDPSLAVQPDGNLALAYQHGLTNVLYIIKHTSSAGWEVFYDDISAGYPKIAFDSAGKTHLIYQGGAVAGVHYDGQDTTSPSSSTTSAASTVSSSATTYQTDTITGSAGNQTSTTEGNEPPTSSTGFDFGTMAFVALGTIVAGLTFGRRRT